MEIDGKLFELLCRIYEYESDLIKWEGELADCEDPEKRHLLESDIELRKFGMKMLKLDMSPEDEKAIMDIAESQGAVLRYFPALRFSEEEAEDTRECLKALNEDDEDLIAYLENSDDPIFGRKNKE